ncbi:hypothetical protein MAPG_07710 [Magnaporthiopsis poae ATCC 64411]|uniref:MIP18 family-like domain-containing protein n=1 Tax=Magnaporthiopsis poae (strain ATCC 64411 / 73-15) TaxID=644358 RepID=A0A0C4E5E4_MAGP6|nr:hypothetical protein MAPG_07710 [Magnaporthiopsis poae ATCC 64411]
MQSSSPDNANPTILNVTQLPSRARHASGVAGGPESKYDSLLASRPTALLWGFSDALSSDDGSDYGAEPIDEQEIYDLISTISDPEHPHTLGQLSVINLPDIHILQTSPTLAQVLVEVTPTITHCSLATVIGLAVRVRLEQALPPGYRVDVRMKAGSHAQDDQVNRQLADKERVAAALENDSLRNMLDKMMETCV